MPCRPWEVDAMFDEKDLVLEAKHVTRRFPTNDGRMLTAKVHKVMKP